MNTTTTTTDVAGLSAGLEGLDQFTPTGAFAVLDLREQAGEKGTVLFCSLCWVGSDAALAA